MPSHHLKQESRINEITFTVLRGVYKIYLFNNPLPKAHSVISLIRKTALTILKSRFLYELTFSI